MHNPKIRFVSFVLTIVIFYLPVNAARADDPAKTTARPATLHSQPNAKAVSRQGVDGSIAATERQSATPNRRGDQTKNASVYPLHLYFRLWRFAFFVLIWSCVAILLSLGIGYFRQRRNGSGAVFAIYAREALGRHRWWMWLLIVTDVFLISNHLLVRGLAVGVWD